MRNRADRWDAFSKWQDSRIGKQAAHCGALKKAIEDSPLVQFGRYFPALASMIV